MWFHGDVRKVPFHRVNLQEINMRPLASNNVVFFGTINANNKLLKALAQITMFYVEHDMECLHLVLSPPPPKCSSILLLLVAYLWKQTLVKILPALSRNERTFIKDSLKDLQRKWVTGKLPGWSCSPFSKFSEHSGNDGAIFQGSKFQRKVR